MEVGSYVWTEDMCVLDSIRTHLCLTSELYLSVENKDRLLISFLITPQLIQLNWLFVFKDHILVWHTLVDDLALTHQSKRNLDHFASLKLTREIYPHFWMHAMQMHILYLTPFYSQNPGTLQYLPLKINFLPKLRFLSRITGVKHFFQHCLLGKDA